MAVGLEVIALVCAIIMKFYLEYQNRQLERLENEDGELQQKDLKKLEKTAEFEGVPVAAARQMQKGYRYMI